MPDDAALVVAWCRQAKRRGALMGDLCLAQEYADIIAERADGKREASRRKEFHDHMDDVFEAWLSVEHHDIWEASKAREDSDGTSTQYDLSKVSDETMEGLLAKLRAATA